MDVKPHPLYPHYRMWYTKDETYQQSTLRRCVKFSASVMAWRCMSTGGVGCLALVTGTINKKLLDYYLIPSLEQLYPNNDADDFIFKQVLVTSSCSKSDAECFKSHNIKVYLWPANLPDLNPTESLWDIMK
uniref:Tc1-like transposase DDE domain-containing protein n=1 Tax=Strigamia maritima TaxID=126957 RepID=T1IPC2_STRMM